MLATVCLRCPSLVIAGTVSFKQLFGVVTSFSQILGQTCKNCSWSVYRIVTGSYQVKCYGFVRVRVGSKELLYPCVPHYEWVVMPGIRPSQSRTETLTGDLLGSVNLCCCLEGKYL